MKLTRTAILALTFIVPSLATVVKAADDKLPTAEGGEKGREAKEDAAQAEGIKVTVTGRLTNLKPAKPYLYKESYLQLLAVPPDGQMRTYFGVADGHFVATYKSDLAKSPISSNGAFRLLVSKLKPGSYWVVVQNTISTGQDDTVRRLLKAKKPWVIEVLSGAKRPLVIGGGDVELP